MTRWGLSPKNEINEKEYNRNFISDSYTVIEILFQLLRSICLLKLSG